MRLVCASESCSWLKGVEQCMLTCFSDHHGKKRVVVSVAADHLTLISLNNRAFPPTNSVTSGNCCV